MTIRIRLFSSFQRHLPEADPRMPVPLTIERPRTISALLESLGLPEDQRRVVTVNDRNVAEDTMLADGDTLKVFPVARGG